MNERESLAVMEAGLIGLMNLCVLPAIPTPPMLLLYAVPGALRSPTPNMEYGAYPPYVCASAHTALNSSATAAAMILL